VLEGLFVTPAVVAIRDALATARAGGDAGGKAGDQVGGAIAVVGNAKLAAALGAAREVIPVGLSPRAAKKLRGAARELAAIEPASLTALVGIDLATAAAWEELLVGWSRVVRDGGVLVIVDRGHAFEASRRALCGGLTEIEQRRAGRSVITSGLVSHFDDRAA
jgi:hypothetical protein